MPREPHTCIATAIPDASKGERIVAFHTDPGVTPQALWERVSSTTLPKLWIPKREDIRYIQAIPTLGTGKIDLRAVRQLALPPLSSDEAQEQSLPRGREQRLQDDIHDETGRGQPEQAAAERPVDPAARDA